MLMILLLGLFLLMLGLLRLDSLGLWMVVLN